MKLVLLGILSAVLLEPMVASAQAKVTREKANELCAKAATSVQDSLACLDRLYFEPEAAFKEKQEKRQAEWDAVPAGERTGASANGYPIRKCSHGEHCLNDIRRAIGLQ